MFTTPRTVLAAERAWPRLDPATRVVAQACVSVADDYGDDALLHPRRVGHALSTQDGYCVLWPRDHVSRIGVRGELPGGLSRAERGQAGGSGATTDAELPTVHHRLLRDPARERRCGASELDAGDERAAPLRTGQSGRARAGWTGLVPTDGASAARGDSAAGRCGGMLRLSRRPAGRADAGRGRGGARGDRGAGRDAVGGRDGGGRRAGSAAGGAGRSCGAAVHVGDDGEAEGVHALAPHGNGKRGRRGHLEPGVEGKRGAVSAAALPRDGDAGQHGHADLSRGVCGADDAREPGHSRRTKRGLPMHEQSAQAFVELDGKCFCRTGDLGHYDEEGYFFHTDRIKRMINASGFKVWPAEVEMLLYRYPAVQEACVIASPDERRGETVKALVVLRESHRGTTPEGIIPWARGGVAAYKCPPRGENVES